MTPEALENLVEQYGLTREQQDAFAAESQRKAAAAIADGRFKSQIVPIVKQTRKGEVVFDTDELVINTLVERYSAQNAEYLRVIRWRELQPIARPTPSRLPGAPRQKSGGRAHAESARVPVESDSDSSLHADFFVDEIGEPQPITAERVLSDLDTALRQSLASGKARWSTSAVEEPIVNSVPPPTANSRSAGIVRRTVTTPVWSR